MYLSLLLPLLLASSSPSECSGQAAGLPPPIIGPGQEERVEPGQEERPVQEEPGLKERVDCHPEPGALQQKCEERGCLWHPVDPAESPGVAWCYFPPGYGYQLVGEPVETSQGWLLRLERSDHPPLFGAESPTVWLSVETQTEQRLRIRISDDKPRFEVPITISGERTRPAAPLYEVTFSQSPSLGVRVTRRSSGELVLDTGLPGLVFSNQFHQLPLALPPGSLLAGWGENEQDSLALDMNYHTWGLYARDQPPDGKANMYGVHPRLTLLDRNGDAAGLLFLNSAAQEVALTPGPGLVYRTIGGVLDLYIFLGPGPEQVVQQYTAAVGRAPLPPYWALGFHLCRFGYNSLEAMKAAVGRTRDASIPQDAQWGDIDIMDRALDFTIDQENFGGLPDYVTGLKEEGVRFVTILDPCVSIGEPNSSYPAYDLGQELDVWVKRAEGGPVVGRVWPEDPVHFPDFTLPRTHTWWGQMVKEFHDKLKFDGLWIDMNEPSNFVTGEMSGCAGNNVNFPPYLPHLRLDSPEHGLADKTLCGDAVHHLGSHYDVHNLYGWSQSQPTLEAVQEATGGRGLVLSRSTFVGSGQWAAHWLGDNFSNWANLRRSIVGMLQFNQFGLPLVGADICGFIGETEEELCARWHQLGAFYPFSRNHNTINARDQDPAALGQEVAAVARAALLTRYTLLPHLYTLFHKHTTEGSTVARPLWHEFPRDNITWRLDDQFLWGSSLLVCPVVVEGATQRTLYLPSSSRWFQLTDFSQPSTWSESPAGWNTVAAPLSSLPLYLRGGAVLPLQEPGLTTQESRRRPLHLLAALDSGQEARGSLYWDDGLTLGTLERGQYFLGSLQVRDRLLTMEVLRDGEEELQLLNLARVVVLGILGDVQMVVVNGQPHQDWSFQNGGLFIENLTLTVNENFQIMF